MAKAKVNSKNKRVRTKNGLPSLFLGMLVGILVGLGAVAGLGAYVYFNLTVNGFNNLFNTSYDLGTEDLNSTTISDLVSHVVALSQNIDSYTLKNLESDFGITVPDTLAGIDITDLKTVPLGDLADALEDKVAALSADDLSDVIDFSDSIWSSAITYYYDSSEEKLYTTYSEGAYSDEVSFDYSVDTANSKVTIKSKEFALSDGKISVELKYLPLSNAIDAILNDITVTDLFASTSSGVLSLVADSTISSLASDLQSKIDTSTFDTLIKAGVVSAPSNYDSIKAKYVNIGTTSEPSYKQVQNLTLSEIITAFFTNVTTYDTAQG